MYKHKTPFPEQLGKGLPTQYETSKRAFLGNKKSAVQNEWYSDKTYRRSYPIM
jgi:hypothetical protein